MFVNLSFAAAPFLGPYLTVLRLFLFLQQFAAELETFLEGICTKDARLEIGVPKTGKRFPFRFGENWTLALPLLASFPNNSHSHGPFEDERSPGVKLFMAIFTKFSFRSPTRLVRGLKMPRIGVVSVFPVSGYFQVFSERR